MEVLLFVMTHLQIMDVKGIFKDIGSVSTHSNASGGCQVTTVTPHGFNDEHTSLGASRRLLDLIAALRRGTKMIIKYLQAAFIMQTAC